MNIPMETSRESIGADDPVNGSENRKSEGTIQEENLERASEKALADGNNRWKSIAVGGVVAIGVSCAAAITSINTERDVGVTAWIAAAIIGSSACISAAAMEGRRHHNRPD